MIDVRQNLAASQTILDMEVLDGADGLQLLFSYASSRYEKETIAAYQKLFAEVAKLLVRCDDLNMTIGALKKRVSI